MDDPPMTILWLVIAAALLIVWVITIVDIVRHHLGAKQTAGWLLLVVLLPFIGAIVYWATRKPEAGEAEYAAAVDQQRRYEAQQRPFDSTRP
jgi:phospholipase D-like protein